MDFCVVVLSSAILLKLLISSRRLLAGSFRFSPFPSRPFANKTSFTSSFVIYVFQSHPCLASLAGVPRTARTEPGGSGHSSPTFQELL